MKRLYVDMDGVLCNYKIAFLSNNTEKYPQSVLGFYEKLLPLQGAIESFNNLRQHYDVWILTRPSVHNLHCYTEKARWVRQYLGFDAQKKLILCCDKSLLKGDYLIDDQVGFGQEEFEGTLINFGSEKFPDWESVVKYLTNKNQYEKH